MKKFSSASKKMLGTGLALLLTVSLLPVPAWAEGEGIAVDKANFPDDVFRQYVSDKIDLDHDNSLSQSERDNVAELRLSKQNVEDLTGIEHFPKLQALICDNDPDLAANGKGLTKLDVTHNPDLEQLDVKYNQLQALDVSQNTALKQLEVQYNQLTALDVSRNTALKALDAGHNQLTALDVSKNHALEILQVSENKLQALNVSNNPELNELYVRYNQLTEMNVGNNKKLKVLRCHGNPISSLNLNNNPLLENVSCEDCKLTALDVANNPNLRYLDASRNGLSKLDLSQNTELAELRCEGNHLTELDVSALSKLEVLHCWENMLTSLDLSSNPNLRDLHAYSNQYKVDQKEIKCTDLPGKFDITKVTGATGGTFDVNSNTFRFDDGVKKATYTYDVGYKDPLEFALLRDQHDHTFSKDWTHDDTHHWHAATCEHKDEVSDKAAHTFGDWKVTLEPTTDKEGLQERVCDVCGYKQEQTIPVLPPKPTEKPEETTAPTTAPTEKPGETTAPTTAPTEKPEETTVPPTSAETTTAPSESTQVTAPSKPATPNTGDAGNMLMWAGMLAASGVIALTTVTASRKRKAD